MGIVEEAEAMETEDQSAAVTKKYYIDTVHLKCPRKGMEMTSFQNDGMSEFSLIPVVNAKTCTYTCLRVRTHTHTHTRMHTDTSDW